MRASLLHQPGNPEVGDDHPGSPRLLLEKDVGALEVAMNDSLAVAASSAAAICSSSGRASAGENFPRRRMTSSSGSPLSSSIVRKLTFSRPWVEVLAELEHPAHVGMRDPPRQLHFLPKALERLGVDDFRTNRLERDALVQRQVLGLPDFPHPPGGDESG